MSTEFPTGAVARVEAQQSHRDFVRAVEPEYVMMKITHARRLMKNGETFASYFGEEPTVITTTTVPDNKLNLLRWEDELEIIRETEPDFHIPTDYSIYAEEMDEEEQLEAVVGCMEGTEWMHNRIADSDIELIPLVKGLTKNQREVCYSVFDELGYDRCAFYATQYFTASGLKTGDLIGDIEQVVVEHGPEMLIIGLLSPNYAKRLPMNVQAVAGQSRWRRRVKPRKQTDAEMTAAYDELANEVAEALEHNPYETDEE